MVYGTDKIRVNQYGNHKGDYNLIQGPQCQKCSYPLTSKKKCRWETNHSKFIDRIYTVGLYIKSNSNKDFLSKHIVYLKNHMKYAYPLGLSIVECIRNKHGELNCNYITYVPQHEEELHIDTDTSEKFDQSNILAKIVSQEINKPLIDIINKKRPESLRDASVSLRRNKVKDLYECKSDILEGKSVLLIDDVFTSGASMYECAEVLKKAGAREVNGFVCGMTILL